MGKLTNNVFFGEHGLTSTAANHLAELAQEVISACKTKLDATAFVNEYVDIVGTPDNTRKQVVVGYDEKKLGTLPELMDKVVKMNAFCAWMREAVKAKEKMDDDVCLMPLLEWCNMMNVEKKDLPKQPEMPTMESIIDVLNVKERCEYFALEAKASSIGQYIHPNQPYSRARKALTDALARPVATSGEGTSLLIYTKEPAVSEEKVEDMYLYFQKEHRQCEQKLNQIKASLKSRLTSAILEAQKAFREEMDKANHEMQKQKSEFEAWRTKERERIAKLKIVVPSDLQETYDYLSSLDK